jgi:hypothetical protein
MQVRQGGCKGLLLKGRTGMVRTVGKHFGDGTEDIKKIGKMSMP